MVATREAQSLWQCVRDQTKSSQRQELEEAGTSLRSDMLAAGRFNLRNANSKHRSTSCAAAKESTISSKTCSTWPNSSRRTNPPSRGTSPSTFRRQSQRPAKLGEALSASVSDERLDPEPTGTRELRDRAFTYLDDLVSEVRTAGRYVFRNSPSTSKLFTSRYRKSQRSRAKKSEPQVELVPGEE
jgi:hypothetical protein